MPSTQPNGAFLNEKGRHAYAQRPLVLAMVGKTGFEPATQSQPDGIRTTQVLGPKYSQNSI